LNQLTFREINGCGYISPATFFPILLPRTRHGCPTTFPFYDDFVRITEVPTHAFSLLSFSQLPLQPVAIIILHLMPFFIKKKEKEKRETIEERSWV
jgi:hypothetical protein